MSCRILWFAALALVVSCGQETQGPEPAAECTAETSQSACRAVRDSTGAQVCVWSLTTRARMTDVGECTVEPREGRCLPGAEHDQNGCSGLGCADGLSVEGIVVVDYYKADGPVLELASPVVCGPVLTGAWKECNPNEPDIPPECDCQCLEEAESVTVVESLR